MNHDERIDETHPENLEARALITLHGARHPWRPPTVAQLLEQLAAPGWQVEPGSESVICKRYAPTERSWSRGDGFPGATREISLTLALAWAIGQDEW